MMRMLYAHQIAGWNCKNSSFPTTESMLCRNTGISAYQLQETMLKSDKMWYLWRVLEMEVNDLLFIAVHHKYVQLHDSTAPYLVDDCQLVSRAGRRRLQSSDIDTCCVPRTNTRFGDRSFAVAGPRLWNSLPATIRQSDNDIGDFCR